LPDSAYTDNVSPENCTYIQKG